MVWFWTQSRTIQCSLKSFQDYWINTYKYMCLWGLVNIYREPFKSASLHGGDECNLLVGEERERDLNGEIERGRIEGTDGLRRIKWNLGGFVINIHSMLRMNKRKDRDSEIIKVKLQRQMHSGWGGGFYFFFSALVINICVFMKYTEIPIWTFFMCVHFAFHLKKKKVKKNIYLKCIINVFCWHGIV